MPAEIRGAMISVFHMLGCLGHVVFTMLSSYLVTNYGAKSPFASMAISQGFCGLIGLVFALLGYIHQ